MGRRPHRQLEQARLDRRAAAARRPHRAADRGAGRTKCWSPIRPRSTCSNCSPPRSRARPGRTTILSETGNFPTDLYIAQGLAEPDRRRRCARSTADAIAAAIDADTAVVMLTHVDYRSGRRHDMAALTAAAHAAGALMLWDLSHSAGAIAVDLNARRRRSRGRLRLQISQRRPRRAGLPVRRRGACRTSSPRRCRAGWAMPIRSPSSPTIAPPPASRASRPARRRSSPWPRSRRAGDASTAWRWPTSRPSRGALSDLFIALVEERCPDARRLASPRGGSAAATSCFAHPRRLCR